MKCLRNVLLKLTSLVVEVDRFAPPILLRYETDDKKSTKTGGCISILLIIILMSFFYNSLFAVLDKK